VRTEKVGCAVRTEKVGCAVRTEKKLQAVDSWCAWRTLQTWLYLNTMILRHIRASLAGSGKPTPQILAGFRYDLAAKQWWRLPNGHEFPGKGR